MFLQRLGDTWPGLVFPQCLGDTSAAYAGQALYSSTVWVTPLLKKAGQALYSSSVWVTPLVDMLARPCIPLCWICWPGFVFLQSLGDTSAGYSGQALYSSNGARGAARASAVTGASRKLHESAAGLVFLRCLGEASAGYAGQALYSSSVWVAPLLDMLARHCIPPMSG